MCVCVHKGKWVVKGHYTALMSEDVIVCILTSPRIIAMLSDMLLHIPHSPWLTLPAVPLLCVTRTKVVSVDVASAYVAP